MQLITAVLSALARLAFISWATASPIADAAVVKRSVPTVQFTVEITAPVTGEFWVTGSENPVQWNTSTIPPQAENDAVSILIGYYDTNNISHVNYGKLRF